jgi:heat shock protein HslJ
MVPGTPKAGAYTRGHSAALAALFVACSGGEGVEREAQASPPESTPVVQPGADLIGGDWSLVTVDMMDGADMEPGPSAPYVAFTEAIGAGGSERLEGSGGCNQFAAEYAIGGNGRMTISRADLALVRTCSDDVMRLEQLMMIALEGATSYERVDDSLSVVFGGGTLRFERALREPAP